MPLSAAMLRAFDRRMNALKLRSHPGLWVALAWGLTLPAYGAVFVQCPGDSNGDAMIDSPDPQHPNARCMHLSGGDGFVKMGDGYLQYIFGFSDLTGIAPNLAMDAGMLVANFPAPTIALKEGHEFYLTLSNAGMVNRPDLFDPHSVHFHGFPNAAAVFDGVPEASIAINMGSSMTYYYNVLGTRIIEPHATGKINVFFPGLVIDGNSQTSCERRGKRRLCSFAYSPGKARHDLPERKLIGFGS